MFIISKNKVLFLQVLQKFLYFILKLVVGVFIIAPLLYIVLPICIALPLYIIRMSLSKWAKHFRPDLGKILSHVRTGMAVFDIYSSEDAFNILVGLEIRGNCPDIKIIRDTFQKRGLEARIPSTGELRYPELTQYVANYKGFLFWAPVLNFKLEDHIYYWNDGIRNQSLDASDSSPLTLKEAQGVLNYLTKKPWTKDCPLWEFIVLPNVINPKRTERLPNGAETKQPNCYFVIFRLHHLLGDAYAVLKFLNRVFLNQRTLEKIAKPDYITRTAMQTLLSGLIFIFRAPFEIADLLLSWFTNPWLLPAETDQRENKIHFAQSESISLNYIKSIKNKHRVGFTSLIFGMITGGCRDMFKKYYGKVPEAARMGGPFPVPGHPDKLTNFVTLGQLNLPLGEADNIKRLKETHKRLKYLGSSTIPLLVFHLSHMLGGVPPVISKMLIQLVCFPPIGIANVFATTEQAFFLESLVEDIYTALNFSHKKTPGYWFTFLSYNGKGRLSVAGLNKFLQSNEHAQELVDLTLQQLDNYAQKAID